MYLNIVDFCTFTFMYFNGCYNQKKSGRFVKTIVDSFKFSCVTLLCNVLKCGLFNFKNQCRCTLENATKMGLIIGFLVKISFKLNYSKTG